MRNGAMSVKITEPKMLRNEGGVSLQVVLMLILRGCFGVLTLVNTEGGQPSKLTA
jgi:hypothetical protein